MINEINGINASDTWHDAIAVFTEVPASSTEATRPNIFRIAGFPRRETVSSNVLAYFFDPAAGHGLKDLMLKALLRTIHKEDMDVSDVSVSTEASTGKNNRIDILLDLPDISIAIENKVDAGLYNDLADYRSWAAEQSNNDSAIVIVLHPFNKFVLKDHPSARGLVVGQDLFDVHYDELFRNALGMLGEYSLDADPRSVDLISRWAEESPVKGKSVTLADNWEWPKQHKPFNNQYYAQSFKLENPGSGDGDRIITCEFFFNIEFNDGYVVSDPKSGSFNTIWYKAYWGGRGTPQKPEVQITDPYNKTLDVKLTASNEDIKNAVEEAIERTLKTCWNI